MGVNFSIKNVPERLAALLKARAKKNHRSLQGELMSILQEVAVMSASESAEIARESRDRDFVVWPRTRRIISVQEAGERMRELGIKTNDDSTEIIRRMRDERYGS